jgi:hypothetical protein
VFSDSLGPKVRPEHVYTDGSKEFKKALTGLGFSKDTSRPYRSQTNGVAERAVRKTKEGTSCVLIQSGFTYVWWPEAWACFCFLNNVTTKAKDGFTSYESKFLTKYKGPPIPMGAEITYVPSAPTDEERLATFGYQTRSGIFIGYDQQAGGAWSEDLLVVDWDELEQAEHCSEVHIKRVAGKEVVCNKPYRFPLAEGICRQPSPNTSARSRARGNRRHCRVWDNAEAADDRELASENEDGGSKTSEAVGNHALSDDEKDMWTFTWGPLNSYP